MCGIIGYVGHKPAVSLTIWPRLSAGPASYGREKWKSTSATAEVLFHFSPAAELIESEGPRVSKVEPIAPQDEIASSGRHTATRHSIC